MPTTGLRERKKRETRAALQSAALRLTALRGLGGVTVEDIAAAADVSPRTFFNYFATKEDAVIAVDPEWTEQVFAVLTARPADEEPLFSLREVFREIAHALVAARDVHVMRRQVLAQNPSLLPRHVAAFVEFERVLVAAISERAPARPSTDPDPALVVAAAVAAMRVTVDAWVDDNGTSELPELLDRSFHRLAVGLTTSRPRTPREDHR